MRIAVTGGTGLVGRFIVEAALAAGDSVLTLSRRTPKSGFFSAPVTHLWFDLTGRVPDLEGVDALVHAGFAHVPGRYRGGEGDDPEGFLAANLQGSLRLFDAARAAGVARIVFLSSRAVYDGYPAGTALTEDLPPQPETLYGRAKLDTERALGNLTGSGIATCALRATGIYGPAGPGQRHKWTKLFANFARGYDIAPRVASEVHGADLAAAVRLALTSAPDAVPEILNVSDLLLDRHDLLAEVAQLTGQVAALPARADASRVNAMQTDRLRALGWEAGGMARLRSALPEMLAQALP